MDWRSRELHIELRLWLAISWVDGANFNGAETAMTDPSGYRRPADIIDKPTMS
jgi:hypothetical protein